MAETSVSTGPDFPGIQSVRRSKWFRRAGLSALVVFLVCGLLGMFGVRTETVTAEGGGYHMSLTHATISRPGLSTPWNLQIVKAGGFTRPILIATTQEYFDLYNQHGIDPTPSKSISDGERLIWEFAPPPGDRLLVAFDARIKPHIQKGKAAETSVLSDTQPVVSVRYKTSLVP